VLTRAIGVFVTIGLFASVSSATAELLKVSVPQRGQWDTAVTELGTRGGVFKKYGLDIEVLYTQGGPESHQAVISGSMDVACGGGIESVIGAYSRGAPLRIIGSEMIGFPRYLLVCTVQFTDQVARGRCWQDNQLFPKRILEPHSPVVAARSVPC
jgi:ABC-type nitrate/sulfonate/bicarbonate transport system substrate-binding protein